MRLILLTTIFALAFTIVAAQKVNDKHSLSTKNWSVGLQFGNFVISGDVRHKTIPGYGLNLSFEKEIDKNISLLTGVFYGKTKGLNPLPINPLSSDNSEVFTGYNDDNPWFPSYECTLVKLNGLLKINLFRFDCTNKPRSSLLYLSFGPGVNSHGVKLDLRNEESETYQDIIDRIGYKTTHDPNTSAGRRELVNALDHLYDGSYETPGPKKYGQFRLGDETNVHLDFNIGFGVAKTVNKRLSIGIEHLITLSDNDLLDGIDFQANSSLTPTNDVAHFTSIQFKYRLGPPEEHSNTLATIDSVCTTNSRRIDELHAKSIQYGALIQKEKNALDTKEQSYMLKAMDSTNNMLQEHIAILQNSYNSLASIVDSLIISLNNSIDSRTPPLLPILYFEEDRSSLSIENKKKIITIAQMVKHYNIECLKITGHTDSKGSHEYNMDLGLARAKSAKSFLADSLNLINTNFTLSSEGELNPIVIQSDSVENTALNRRVTFQICPVDK